MATSRDTSETPTSRRPPAHALAQLRQALALVDAVVCGTPGESLPPDVAREATKLLGTLEKRCAAGAVHLARLAGRDAAHVLASAKGSSLGKVRAGVRLAERLAGVPSVGDAFRRGMLSIDQAAVIAPALRAAPGASERLLELARSSQVAALRTEVSRILQRARGEESQQAMERRLSARRFCRYSFPASGGMRLEALLPAIDGARVKAALDHAAQRRFESAWAAGDHLTRLEQLRADALVDVLTGAQRAGRTGAGTAEVLVRVDAAALQRGALGREETCEIAGVGAVSVAAARELLCDGFLTLLVQDGVDIRTVTSTRRTIPRRVRKALELRDGGCVVPGCGSRERLQVDHWRRDYSWSGPTELDNLALECEVHHRMRTRQGWQLLGGPGRWRWLPPKSPEELAELHAHPRRSGSRGRGP